MRIDVLMAVTKKTVVCRNAYAVWYKCTNVSEKLAATIVRADTTTAPRHNKKAFPITKGHHIT